MHIVKRSFVGSGESSHTDSMGMRQMQALAYEARAQRYLLIKAPPASGKSRALMFVALSKLHEQGLKRVVVSVPERSIGGSFANTDLVSHGFPYDWRIAPYYNLCLSGDSGKADKFREFMRQSKERILLCPHATLRNAMRELPYELWDDCLLAIDEFHHTSADSESGLGEVVRRVMRESTAHIVAMTGSYFRGDGVPVLLPEDEALFYPITYNYYQQLSGYKHLRHLRLGYHFYQGSYLEHLGEVLDTSKKTIIHIPSVNSRASTGDKYEEVRRIMEHIGKVVDLDYSKEIYTLETSDGRRLKVANLVDDRPKERGALQAFLQQKLSRDALDMIIALGTAKEGFDWEWCECCLTIGVRGSLTEVIQIIGRCTRDSEGKSEATFINMIAQPTAEMADVKLAVNDFLKAITASLLMEQVMAPNWSFKTKPIDITPSETESSWSIAPGGITMSVPDLTPLTSPKAQDITDKQIEDMIATVIQHDSSALAMTGAIPPGQYNRLILPKIVREKLEGYDLSEIDKQAVIERVKLTLHLRGKAIVTSTGEEPEPGDLPSEGQRFLRLAGKLLALDDISINLIDSLNPYRDAYELISKQINKETLAIMQDSIDARRYEMTAEEAQRLYPSLKAYISERGKEPSRNDADYEYRRLAVALATLRTECRKHVAGLPFTTAEGEQRAEWPESLLRLFADPLLAEQVKAPAIVQDDRLAIEVQNIERWIARHGREPQLGSDDFEEDMLAEQWQRLRQARESGDR